MPSYNLKFNKDDSVIRHIIVGLLADLNSRVFWFNQVSQEERVKVDIPFYYSFTGDEGLLHDYFLLDGLADPEQTKALSNYESVPRCMLTFQSLSIDSASLVNKYVRGTFQKLEENDTMRQYVAQFQLIPVIMSFDAQLVVDSELDQFKGLEKIIKRLYKNNQFNVDVGTLQDGTYRICSYYKLPEDYEKENPVEFSFDDQKNYFLNFNIELLSFIPSFEMETEQFAGNRMMNIEHNTFGVPDNDNPPDDSDSLANQVNQ